MQEDKKRKIKKITLSLSVIALTISGSLAWRDISQHKTNKFNTKSVSESIVLVEDVDNTTYLEAGKPVVNQVFVKNGQNIDDVNKYVYSDALVRVQLREFLGKSNSKPTLSEHRYLIDTNGDFIIGSSLEEAYELAKKIWPGVSKNSIEQYQTPKDKGNGAPANGYYYVRTDENSPNGIYGKLLVKEYTSTELESVIDDKIKVEVEKLDEHQGNANVGQTSKLPGHNNNDALNGNQEDKNDYFTTRSWKTKNNISESVELNLGSKVKKLSEWNGNPGKFWVIDDSNDEGWIYWMEPLKHDQDASVAKGSMTYNIVESFVLVKKNIEYKYRLHVNLDSVSKDEVDDWNENNYRVPSNIREALKVPYSPQEKADYIFFGNTEQIINEEINKNKAFPFSSVAYFNRVSQSGASNRCSATVVGRDYVMSAHHCARYANHIFIRPGYTDGKDILGSWRVEGENVWKHPKWVDGQPAWDVSVLKVSPRIVNGKEVHIGDVVKPLTPMFDAVSSKRIKAGDRLNAIGYPSIKGHSMLFAPLKVKKIYGDKSIMTHKYTHSGGSSGQPLLDELGNIIGTFYGGELFELFNGDIYKWMVESTDISKAVNRAYFSKDKDSWDVQRKLPDSKGYKIEGDLSTTINFSNVASKLNINEEIEYWTDGIHKFLPGQTITMNFGDYNYYPVYR